MNINKLKTGMAVTFDSPEHGVKGKGIILHLFGALIYVQMCNPESYYAGRFMLYENEVTGVIDGSPKNK